jgi:Ion channel
VSVRGGQYPAGMHEGAMLPEDAPAWQRHFHGDGYGYGWLLLLIGFSIAFQLASPEAEWARLFSIVLQGFTLIAALTVSGVRRWLIHIVSLIFVLAVVAAVGIIVGSGRLGDGGGAALGLLLAALAPAAIIVGVVRQTRRAGRITVRTMFGVLCVYLLVGTTLAYAYGIIDALEDNGFFAQITDATQADFLYFSFSTLTTTGFGDLTAAEDLGRSLAITEALVGQIYLVTLVALIVGNLGRAPVAR